MKSVFILKLSKTFIAKNRLIAFFNENEMKDKMFSSLSEKKKYKNEQVQLTNNYLRRHMSFCQDQEMMMRKYIVCVLP